MKTHYAMFADYNCWANARVYNATAKLSQTDYRADRGAFFKSIHGTLNHLLVADRVWMRRFTGEGNAPDRLDAILFEQLAPLRAARALEDERIIAFIDSLDEAKIAATFRYQRMASPETFEQPLAPTLAHFFNHQTHHRGQVHALLTAIARDAPPLDLVVFQRESGMGGGRPIA